MESNINSAIQKGFFQQIRFLLEFGHSTNVRDKDRRTPLINCAFIEDETWAVGIARMLLENDGCIGLKDKMGLNAFQYACIYERQELVKVYLSAIDFDLNATDRQGNTALHHAVTTGNQALLTQLIDAMNRYKISVDKANKKGITPLIQAYKNMDLASADILIHQGNACKDVRDMVEFKTGHEWEHEAVILKEQEEQRRRQEKAKRPRTAFARLQQAPSPPGYGPKSKVGKVGRLTRVPSAPLLRRRNSSNTLDKENEEDEIIARGKLSTKLYRSASTSDLRNKPEFILNISPLHCFTSDKHVNYLAKQGHFVQQEDGSWRFEMKSLYNKFEFQFTNSYRKGAVPPPPGSLLHSLHPIRALSPAPSECDSSKKGSLRRGSVRSPTSSEVGKKNRVSSANPRNRRSSLLSAAGSSRTQLTTTDSSSNESVNSLTKQKRKGSSSSVSQDFKDDVSESSTQSSKSDPGRPQSRAMNHPTAKKEVAPATNHNLAAIKE